MSGCRTFCLIAALALLAGCSPRSSTAPADTDKSTQTRIDYQLVRERAEAMLPNIRRHAQVLAGLGPRQTGQRGCELAMAHIRTELEGMGLGEQISEFSSKVTVPLDRTDPGQLSSAQEPFIHVVVEIPGQQAQRWPAHAFVPNCAQACATHPAARCPLAEAEAAGPHCTNCERPRRLVDLGTGSWEEFKGKDLQDAVVLLDFNSGEAWLRAASLGAYGAIFTEPQRTTVFQADMKYRATLPLHFPRLYLRKTETDRLKDDLTKNAETLRVTVASRLRFQNVPARCLELTIPGKRRDYCFVLAGHFDARCIVPDLSFGAAEVWGIGELIELTRHFATHQPNCDIRIIFTSGHWQSQQAMRDHVAYDPKAKGTFEKINRYFKVAMGVDLDPEGRSVNLINEAAWNVLPLGAYSWLRQELFQKGGWRDETLQELGLGAEGVELFGGVRAEESETLDGVMASRNDRSPLMYAPRYPTAEEPWQAMGMTTFAFQTGRLARLAHNTPLDLLGKLEPKAIDHQLRPQVQITLAVLDHLQQYPPHLFPDRPAGRRGGKGWGGYAMLKGRTQQWDRSIGWFSGRLPAEADGTPLRTFVQAYPVDSVHQSIVAARPRNYLKWPLNPNRGQHRELQSFMFQDLLLLEHSHFQINTVYAGYPSTQYNVVAYSLDAAGRIRYATDFGIHGDSNKSFQCTDVDVDTWDMWIPVSLFECGTLELFHLIDPQRYNPSDYVRGTWYQGYYIHGGHADRGVAPHLRVEGVKDVDSHTDIDRWGFAQYGPDAMIFLPANFHTGAEILLGQWHTNFAVLSNPDAAGKSQGFRMSPGQRIRLSSNDEPTALTCVRQLTALNEQRLTEFERYDVRSPLPETYQQASIEAVEAGRAAQRRGEYEQALANYARGWIAESGAYRNTLKLLLDVVSTTVLYFVLLLPFSFLMERLIFPQRTVLRTAIVSVVIFSVFASFL